MKNLALVVALLAALSFAQKHAGAATLSGINAAEFQLNQASPEAMRANQLGSAVEKNRMRVLKATYSFTVQGGSSAAAIVLRDGINPSQPAKLPKNAIVRNCVIDTLTAPTSGGSATIAIGTGQAANDLKAATAYGSYSGLVACVPVGTAATSIKLTADRTMTLTIGTANLTAGKLNVLVEYDISE